MVIVFSNDNSIILYRGSIEPIEEEIEVPFDATCCQ